MLDFNKVYRVSFKGGGTPGFNSIAVGIRPFRAAYPPPYEHYGVGDGLEWIPASPTWPVERAFVDIVSATPDRIEARAKLPEFAGQDVSYVFEPLTAAGLHEIQEDILNFNLFMSDLASDEDVQEFYRDTWLKPRTDWLSPGAEELGEAVAEVGDIHPRADGYNWQKQLNKTWVRVGRTYAGPVQPGEDAIPGAEGPSIEKAVVFGKWPEIEVPAGGTWKAEAEGFEHLVRGPRGPSTLATYYNTPVGNEDPEPLDEHDERFQQIWDEMHRASRFTSPRTSPKEGHRPVAVLTMGVPASGKSQAVNNTVAKEGFVHIDPDEIKKLIPEYGEAIGQRAKNAANLVHQESSFLADGLRNHAIAEGKNFIFEGLARDPVWYGALIDHLKDKGYEVQLVMTHVENADAAVERSKIRGEQTGRWVSEEIIRSTIPAIPKSFAQLKDKVDSFAVYDTEEFPPKLAWARLQGGDELVPDPELKDRLSRGELRRPPVPEAKLPPTAPADIEFDKVLRAFERSFEFDHAETQLTPRRFRRDQGIEMPVDYPFNPYTKPSKLP